jgi:hypothetical protein
MTFQAYLDTIKAKTGKTPDDFRELAARKGLTEYRELMIWLKTEYELGHGHANVIAQMLARADKLQASPDDKLAAHFAGAKAHWRATYNALLEKLAAFGDDFKSAPTNSYISLLRGTKKFAILQISAAERIDLGIKNKNLPIAGRLEAAGSWNNMVTHRVRISEAAQLDAEALAWLKQAYDLA